jgi:hypothetical protein
MLGVWDLAGLEARDWGFSVIFLGFFRVSFFTLLMLSRYLPIKKKYVS